MFAALQSSFLGKLAATAIMSMIPVVELRGGIPFGTALGLEPYQAMLAAVVGNLIPVPFILIYIRRLFIWMRRFEPLGKIADYLENKAEGKKEKVTRYKIFGLCIFVAIPLPGTGAWTGALIAAFLDMDVKQAFPSIAVGVLIAAFLVTAITFGVVTIV